MINLINEVKLDLKVIPASAYIPCACAPGNRCPFFLPNQPRTLLKRMNPHNNAINYKH